MLTAASDWLRHLVVLILLAVFLEVVLPGGTMQKYVRTVLALIIMMSMLQPLAALFRAHLNPAAIESAVEGPLFTSAGSGREGAGLAIFRRDLADSIAAGVQGALGIRLQNVQIATEVKPDGTPIVMGVTAFVAVGPGIKNASLAAREAKAQIALTLGLAPTAVTVYFPGGRA